MSDVEVHIELEGQTHRVGLLRRNVSKRAETATFEYDQSWMGHPHRFPIDPSLPLTKGTFPPPKNMVESVSEALRGVGIRGASPDAGYSSPLPRASPRAASRVLAVAARRDRACSSPIGKRRR